MEDSVRFSVDAALFFELGERLVSRKSIALAELIKNAYDADATEVIITLTGIESANGTIEIEDNGHGMTLQDVQDHWMRIATSDKVLNPISPRYHRNRTGAKGIGRFATRRLATRLRVDSIAQVDSQIWEQTIVSFYWDQYRSGMAIEDVPNAISSTRSEVPLRTGTRLFLDGLRDSWSEAEVQEVRDDLLNLTRPSQSNASEDPGFTPLFIVPEYPESEGDVFEDFLKTAIGVLRAYVRPDGTPLYTYSSRGSDKTTSFAPDSTSFPSLVGANATIRHFVFKSEYFLGTGFGVSTARSMGRTHGGVRVYLDQFRVFPYGDTHDDWLSLDEIRAGRLTASEEVLKGLLPEDVKGRALLDVPGNNQLFGEVHVSRRLHPEIMPMISRIGLVENDSFRDLQRFVRLGINWMTIQRRSREEHEKTVRPKESKRPVIEIVDTAVTQIERTLLGRVSPLELTEVNRALDGIKAAVQSSEEEHLGKLGMLRTLASAGTMVLIFTHQIRAIIDQFKGVVADLDDGTLALTSEDFSRMRVRLRSGTEVIEAQAKLLGLLLGEGSRSRRRKMLLRPSVDDLIGAFGRYCADYGILISNSVPERLRTPAVYEAEVHSMLLNLLTNSLKAVRERETREIDISAMDGPRDVTILVRDTGQGVPPNLREWVFEPFNTTSNPDPVLGVGTGLGLTIVRDIVADYGGTVRFVDPKPPWGVCAEIIIPKELEE